MKGVVAGHFNNLQEAILGCIQNFNTSGTMLNDGARNTIKVFEVGHLTINVKSFKKPNLVNKIVYRFFRKSKAQRSFEYANKLKQLGIGTPEPYAYYEKSSALFFGESYYACEHLNADLVIRELTFEMGYPDQEDLVRAFTRFCYELHEKKVNFLDHSAGNTLITLKGDIPEFYLVDLNRMRFESMDLDARMKNLCKLTTHESVARIMSNEYAKCSGEDEEKVFDLLWGYTKDFQYRFHRKKKLKKLLKFWK